MPRTSHPRARWGGARAALSPLALAAAVAAAASTGAAARTPTGFADLAERLLPAVVNISTTQTAAPQQLPDGDPPAPGGPPSDSPFEDFFREFFERQRPRAPTQPRTSSLGSGFVVDPAGMIVTNNHVVAKADEITVTFSDDSKLSATVVGRDAKTDLALLQVEPDRKLTAVSFGDSDRTRIGDWVIAIGNPFGLGGSVTAGIVSARGRDIRAGPYDDFIQTDASINKGNSGGPMFNLRGEVIGVNTAIFSPTGANVGIGFAIPSNLARPIVAQLREHGRARRGWLGVRIQTVTDEIAQGLGLDEAGGALVAGVSDGSPAAEAGILVGDVILRFDGRQIDEMRRLPRLVADESVGKTVRVVLWRKGTRKTVRVVLGEFPEDEALLAARSPAAPAETSETSETVVLGLKLATVTPELRERFDLEEEDGGVVVTEVVPGSPGAEKRIMPGDIVARIGSDQAAVTSPEQVRTAIEEAKKKRAKHVLVLLQRGGDRRFAAVRLPEG